MLFIEHLRTRQTASHEIRTQLKGTPGERRTLKRRLNGKVNEKVKIRF